MYNTQTQQEIILPICQYVTFFSVSFQIYLKKNMTRFSESFFCLRKSVLLKSKWSIIIFLQIFKCSNSNHFSFLNTFYKCVVLFQSNIVFRVIVCVEIFSKYFSPKSNSPKTKIQIVIA